MPVQPVDFVPEVGAYKQRIEKELRTLKPRGDGSFQPPLGPYAIPDKLPADLVALLKKDDQGSRCSTSSSQRSTRSNADPQVTARLCELEKQILEEREGRRHVEAQLDRLQTLLEQLAAKQSNPTKSAGVKK